MVLDLTARDRLRTAALLAAAVCLAPRPAAADDCATAVANKDCTVTIDREKPVEPLPIRATSQAKVTIRVPRRPLEAIGFDEKLADTAAPDVIGAIFAAFVPGLQAVQFGTGPISPSTKGPIVAPPPPHPVETALKEIDADQQSVKAPLEAVERRIDTVGKTLVAFSETAAGTWTLHDLTTFRHDFPCDVHGEGKKLDDTDCEPGAGTMPLPSGVIGGLRIRLKDVMEQFERLSAGDRQRFAPALNAVSNNQHLLEESLASLQKAQAGLVAAAEIVKAIDPVKVDPIVRYQVGGFPAGSNRTATVTITAKDIISKEKTELTTVVVKFGDTRWEVSGGVLFSTVPSRAFANEPMVENGVPVLNGDGDQLTRIVETDTRPTVVPIALAHYRLGEWPIGAHNRFAFLLSGGLGVNPYSKSADVFLGGSIAFRGLMISPMFQWTQDQALTGGLAPGQELGASPPDLITERHWVTKWGVGLSYRIPIN